MTQANSKVFLDSEQYGGNDGLTKREFFAAMAMGGIVEAGNVPDKTDAE